MGNCILCGDPVEPKLFPNVSRVFWVECRHCGRYGYSNHAAEEIEKHALGSRGRLNLIAYTSKHQSREQPVSLLWKCQGESADFPGAPETIRDIEDFVDAPIQHAQKPDELLRLIANKLTDRNPFEEVTLTIGEVRRLKISDWAEFAQWREVLASKRLVQVIEHSFGMQPRLLLTPSGWSRAEELFGNVGSKTCFIAMSFTLPERAAVQGAIEDACRVTGWTAKIVDREEYAGGVMDKILALINQARFVIADYTQNKGGVYYEAGYALGRGLPVICTVKHGHLDGPEDKVHFDTRHLNFIVWKTPEELKQRLEDRIGAVINK